MSRCLHQILNLNLEITAAAWVTFLSMGLAILKHPDIFIDSLVKNWVLYKAVQVTILICNIKMFWTKFYSKRIKILKDMPNLYQVYLGQTIFSTKGCIDDHGLECNLWTYWCLKAILSQGPCRSEWPEQRHRAMVSSGAGLVQRAMSGPWTYSRQNLSWSMAPVTTEVCVDASSLVIHLRPCWCLRDMTILIWVSWAPTWFHGDIQVWAVAKDHVWVRDPLQLWSVLIFMANATTRDHRNHAGKIPWTFWANPTLHWS